MGNPPHPWKNLRPPTPWKISFLKKLDPSALIISLCVQNLEKIPQKIDDVKISHFTVYRLTVVQNVSLFGLPHFSSTLIMKRTEKNHISKNSKYCEKFLLCVSNGRNMVSLQGRRRVFKSGPAEEIIECRRHERGRTREGDSPSR